MVDKADDENCRKFLDIQGDELKTKEEIKKCYDYISTNYINQKLSKLLAPLDINDEIKESIKKQLPNNIKEIIENIFPSYQCNSISMDINENIKIKLIKGNSFSSTVIKGYAMTKYVCFKNYGGTQVDCKILFLDFDLNENEMKDPFVKVIKEKNKAENENKDNIGIDFSLSDYVFKAIECFDINVILLRKGISYALLEKFTEKSEYGANPKVYVVMNVEEKPLEKIANCTKGKVIKSLDEFKNLIDNKEDDNKKSNFVGACKFEIVEINKFIEEKNEEFNFEGIIKNNDYEFEKMIYKPSTKLMKFEPKKNNYFQTLLLSYNEKNLLDMIKKELKEEIFITVRDFFLQQKVLHFLFCKIEFKLPEKTEEKKEPENEIKPFKFINTIKRKIELDNKKLNSDKENGKADELNKEINKPSKKINFNNDKIVNNIKVIINNQNVSESPGTPKLGNKNVKSEFSTKKQESLFIHKNENNPIIEDDTTKLYSDNNMKGLSENTNNNLNYNLETDVIRKISNFSLGQNENNDKIKNPTEKIIFIRENIDIEEEGKSIYKFGFDTSVTKKNDEKNSLKLIKLKMCKGKKKLKKIEVSENGKKRKFNKKQLIMENEAEIVKKLNFICKNAENMELVYYCADTEIPKDKQFGKFIMDMLDEKYKMCPDCENNNISNQISNHFYYLYNSNNSRIKISYISKEDSNLEQIIEYISSSKNKDFKYQDKQKFDLIDYNKEIYCYGLCKICKKIVTPVIQLPKDFYAYSTAKFFKHISNNTELKNRQGEEYNLIKSYKNIIENNFSNNCSHSSFQDIKRIFFTKYGALEFQYENIDKYQILSVQKSPEQINSSYTLEITEVPSTSENKSQQTSHQQQQNQQNKESKEFQEFKKIISLIKNKFEKEIEEIIKLKSLEYVEKSSAKNIIDTIFNLLKEIIKYMKIDSTTSPPNTMFNESNINNENIRPSPSPYNNSKGNLIMAEGNIQNEDCYLNNKDIKNNDEQEFCNRKSINTQTSFGTNVNDSVEIKEKHKCLIDQLFFFSKDEVTKNLGYQNRVFFRLAQLKILCNKIRIFIHQIKIYISLENSLLVIQQKLKDNDDKKEVSRKIPSDGSNNKTSSISIKSKMSSNINVDSKIPSDNIRDAKAITIEKVDNSIQTALLQSPPISNTLNVLDFPKYELKNKSSELSKSMTIDNIIKEMIDKYILLGDIYETEDKKDNSLEVYLKMLNNITFYEERPNDSNVVKENDLSSIIYYGISSQSYQTFMKEKTNLLDFKNNEKLDKNKDPNKKPEKEEKASECSLKNENIIKDDKDEKSEITTPLIDFKFDPSDIKYKEAFDSLFIFNSQKNIDQKYKVCLESELMNVSNESQTPLLIVIKNINEEKLTPTLIQSRKPTISRTTKSMKFNSPILYTSKNEKNDDIEIIIENKLNLIEETITGYFNTIGVLNSRFKKLKNEMKLVKNINEYLKALNEISAGYNKLNEVNINTENNNEIEKNEKKKKLINGFIKSIEEQINSNSTKYSSQNNNENKTGLEHDIKDDEKDNNLNLIDLIGTLYFVENSIPKSEIEITIFFPRQFESLRIFYCSTYKEFLKSLKESNAWKNVSGGKSKAKFYKTKDEKYLFKSIDESEFKMFLEIAGEYFIHMSEYLFHQMPSLLMKILGVYRIRIKKEDENHKEKEENFYLMMMENLNYGLDVTKGRLNSYDLKGSEANRYINKESVKGKENVVLHDNNFKEDFNNEPIPINKTIYDLLIISVHNDTVFLSKIGVVDYSLLLHIYHDDKQKKHYLRMGIIDYNRKYTWDKQLEHFAKMIINGFVVSPTITSPNKYRERFKNAIKNYFICV